MGIIRNKKSNFNYQRRATQYRRPLVFSGNKINVKQKKEKKAIPKFVWSAIFSLLILGLAGYFLFFSSYFRVSDILIQGNSLTTEERIKSYIPDGSNVLLFNIPKTKALILSENPEIKDIEIYRGIPNAFKIVVLEYDNKLIWESNGIQYLVSSQGRVTKQLTAGDAFAYPRVVDSKKINVVLGSNIVSPSFVSFVLNINNSCFEVTNVKPVYYEVPETTFDLNLYTDAGFYVKLNTVRSSAKQLDNLKKVLVAKKSEIKEYVDLRIDGLAYYK